MNQRLNEFKKYRMQTEYLVMVASVRKRGGSSKNVIGNVDSFVLYNTILVSPSSELLYWARNNPKKVSRFWATRVQY